MFFHGVKVTLILFRCSNIYMLYSIKVSFLHFLFRLIWFLFRSLGRILLFKVSVTRSCYARCTYVFHSLHVRVMLVTRTCNGFYAGCFL